MKYTNVIGFEKHLRKSAPDHFSPITLILSKDRFEESYYGKKVRDFFLHFFPNLLEEKISISKGIDDAIFSASLFGEERLIIIERIDELKGKDLERLEATLSSLPQGMRVTLSASSVPKNWYASLEKHLVALDLRDEKPWEKKRRIAFEIGKIFSKEKKNITPDLIEIFLERVGYDMAVATNEALKLVTYLGEEKSVTEEAIKAVTILSEEINTWEITEDVVWNDKKEFKRPSFKDLSEFLALLGQIRYQLYMGIELAESLRENREPKGRMPPPKILEERKAFCKKIGADYFARLLQKVFEIECKAKSVSVDPHVLFDEVLIYALSTA